MLKLKPIWVFRILMYKSKDIQWKIYIKRKQKFCYYKCKASTKLRLIDWFGNWLNFMNPQNVNTRINHINSLKKNSLAVLSLQLNVFF